MPSVGFRDGTVAVAADEVDRLLKISDDGAAMREVDAAPDLGSLVNALPKRVEGPAEGSGPKDEDDAGPQSGASLRWGSKPSVKDQLQRLPETVRMVNHRTLTFVLPEQLTEMNQAQAASSGAAPTMVVMSQERHFFEGKWFVLMDVRDVQYAVL
jgi:hypothetical protein